MIADINDTGVVELIFSDGELFEMTDVGEITIISENDHTRLINRDSNNQHPISAVTNLTNELNTRPSEVISDSFINLLN